MSAASMINKFGQTVVVKRATANGSYVDGMYVAPALEEIEMKAYVGDAKGKEKKAASDGDRNARVVTVYTVATLYPSRDERPADRLLVDGAEFEITAVKTYLGKCSVSIAEEIDD